MVATLGDGLLGWNFIRRTSSRQLAALETTQIISRESLYFKEHIEKIGSANDLIVDRRLLSVALSAFGLKEDLPNKAFIRKVLEEGTRDDRSFANRLSDKRYREMSAAFGFDLKPPNTVLNDFPSKILKKYLRQEFEERVGDTAPNIRLALSFERNFNGLTASRPSEDAFWYTVIGTPTLRKVFETAMNVPSVASGLDVDRQLEIFKKKALVSFGTSQVDNLRSIGSERIIRDFLLRSEVSANTSSAVRGSVALALLQSQLVFARS